MLGHHMHLGLERVVGKSCGSLVFLGRERSKEITGDANGGRQRLARAREGVKQGSFIAPGARRGGWSQRRGLQW
jgi:hypothetical protein